MSDVERTRRTPDDYSWMRVADLAKVYKPR